MGRSLGYPGYPSTPAVRKALVEELSTTYSADAARSLVQRLLKLSTKVAERVQGTLPSGTGESRPD